MKKPIAGLIVWLLVSLAAGFIGSRFMPGEWYEALNKPSWNPPSSVFGPVWTTLYILMGIAAWLVWRKVSFAGAHVALTLFIIQLVLNALWSFLFFGIHRPDMAFIEIIILWVLILATIIGFWRISMLAGILLLPYLLWVSFASVLNLQLWRLNV
jgi:tryptophan-rich sensory protein